MSHSALDCNYRGIGHCIQQPSTDQHYFHYYSYYYNSNETISDKRETVREQKNKHTMKSLTARALRYHAKSMEKDQIFERNIFSEKPFCNEIKINIGDKDWQTEKKLNRTAFENDLIARKLKQKLHKKKLPTQILINPCVKLGQRYDAHYLSNKNEHSPIIKSCNKNIDHSCDPNTIIRNEILKMKDKKKRYPQYDTGNPNSNAPGKSISVQHNKFENLIKEQNIDCSNESIKQKWNKKLNVDNNHKNVAQKNVLTRATNSETDSESEDIDNSNPTSDSEDGYRNYVFKLTHEECRESSKQNPLQLSNESIPNPRSVLVSSLFPNVAPYLAFSNDTNKGPAVPADLFRVLKWRVTNIMPKVVRRILINSGMRLLKKTNDWIGVWGRHMRSPCFKSIRSYQKINHLPGSFRIGRKDSCWRNLSRQMNKHGKQEFGFMPRTFVIPNDLNLLRKTWPAYMQKNTKWIIKPPAAARGTGVRVVNQWAQIPKKKPLIVQKYIERPLLINGSKFDIRLYALVTSINPLRVFLYHDGLARFASVKYSEKPETLNNRCMHLTNYSINKFSSNYSKNEDVNACHGHKWTLKSLWSYLANRGIQTDSLWEALKSLVLRTILAGEQSMNCQIRNNVESKYTCFELFGFDVLLDSNLIPWLLEVNISPSLHSELPLDAHVKAPLVQAVLNTGLYQIPPKIPYEKQKRIAAELHYQGNFICFDKRLYFNTLSSYEKTKHDVFTRKTMESRNEYVDAILENLTPDDVRCLVVAEDELARCAPLERIFPTTDTYKYLKFTENPRYYNRLLDAWESRYCDNRSLGIALLSAYCAKKYHLEVPTIPIKQGLPEDEKKEKEVNNNNKVEAKNIDDTIPQSGAN